MRIVIIVCFFLSLVCTVRGEVYADESISLTAKDINILSDSLVYIKKTHPADPKYYPVLFKYYDKIIKWNYFKKNYRNCVKYGFEFFNFTKKTSDPVYITESLKLMALVNLDLQRYEVANKYFEQLSQLATRQKDTLILIQIYLGKSKVADKLKDVTTATRNLFYAFYLAGKFNNQLQKAIVFKDIGLHYIGLGDFDRSIFYFNKALNINQKIYTYSEQGVLYTLISHIYQETKDYNESIKLGLLALEVREKAGQKDLYISSLINLGKIYLVAGNLDSAYYYLKSGEKHLTEITNSNISSAAYKHLYAYYNQKGNYKVALEYYEKYNNARENMDLEKSRNLALIFEANQDINELEIKSGILDAANKIQKAEIAKKRIQILLLFILVFFLSILSFTIYYILKKIKKEKKIQEELNKRLYNELNEKKSLELSLRESERHYRFVSDHSPDVILREDMNFRKKYVSPSSQDILGYSPEEIINAGSTPIYVHEESIDEWKKGMNLIKDTKLPQSIIFRVKSRDNTRQWAECLVNPLFQDGELLEMVSVIRNITERIEHQEEIEEYSRHKELLVREVNHRVKNNLGILLSLIRMHAFRFSDEQMQELLRDLQFRLKTIALVHDQLNANKKADELSTALYFMNLVKTVVNAFNDENITVDTYFYDEMVHVDVLQPLGLILNELVTNVFKYAFPGNRKGNIRISYEKSGDSDGKMRTLTISDDGIGLNPDVDFFASESMGSQLIKNLSQQLNAEIFIDGTNGVTFKITLPVRSGKSKEN